MFWLVLSRLAKPFACCAFPLRRAMLRLPISIGTTDETFLIESGEVEVNLGGELFQGRRGDVIYLPRGILHAPQVRGNDRLTVIVLCVPGGFDRFFAACAAEFEKGEPEMPRLVELAGEYGIKFQFDPSR
jgi:Cupin domain